MPIARLQGQIATPTFSQSDRYVARANLAQAQLDLANLNHAARNTATQAAMADLSVTLRTAAARKRVVAPVHESGISRSARDALAILGAAGRVAVYLLIVSSPLLLIGAIAGATRRRLRVHRERLLLESA